MAHTVTAYFADGTGFPFVTGSRDRAYHAFDEYRAAIDGAHAGVVYVELASDGVTHAMHGTPPAPVAVEPEPAPEPEPEPAPAPPKPEPEPKDAVIAERP